MTISECYGLFGGNYEEAVKRLMNDRLIEKFILKFLNDPSFGELEKAMENNDTEGAFRASHTLKGVAGNLSFSALAESSSALTESLRGKSGDITAEAKVLFIKARKDYEATVDAITSYQGML